MSLALSTLLNIGTAIGQVSLRIPRGIQPQDGPLILPDCIIEESSNDALQITDHPVEIGTTISDHAYNKPREVTLRWSWSNTGRGNSYMQDVYLMLKVVQSACAPMIIYTGKSNYRNMLIASLGVMTNNTSEFTLNAVMVCREIIVVSTQTAQVSTPQSPQQSAQEEPQTTAAQVKRGPVGLKSGGGGGLVSPLLTRSQLVPNI